jgi:CO/xanthine dehydrogenase FAD-binding subunit
MKPAAFSYLRPDTIAETLAALADHGSDGRIIAGGQSLGAMLNMRLVTPKVLIDINRIVEGPRVEAAPGFLRIGATVRQSDAMRDAKLDPVEILKAALPHVGHFQTRNRGTICGSLAHADPSAELPLALLVGEGSVELRSRRGSRTVGANEFFLSTLTTVRRDEEMIAASHWPVSPPRSGCAFDEFAIRGGDYAIVAAAAQVELGESGDLVSIRAGLAGIGERPLLIDTSGLTGEMPSDAIADEIAARARRGIEPVDDLQATATYRTHLAGVYARKVFGDAVKRARQRIGYV